MDLDGQEAILQAVQEHGGDNVIVVLGAPDAESAGLYAETLVKGDPTYVGPLAGVPLGLPVYHITEPQIRAQIDPQVYQEQVGVMELALEVDKIAEAVSQVRQEALAKG